MVDNETDPYAILGIPYNADDGMIHEAFSAKISKVDPQSQDSLPFIHAYGMIRNQVGRNHYRWNNIRSFITDPFSLPEKRDVDLVALAKELAFLSSWELGEEECPM
jgi:hypothetical protein